MLIVLALIILVGLVAVFGLTGYGFGTLARHRKRSASLGVALSSLAAITSVAAVASYVWGLLLVAGAVLGRA